MALKAAFFVVMATFGSVVVGQVPTDQTPSYQMNKQPRNRQPEPATTLAPSTLQGMQATPWRVTSNYSDLQKVLIQLQDAIDAAKTERATHDASVEREITNATEIAKSQIEGIKTLQQITVVLLIAIFGGALVVWQSLVRIETNYKHTTESLAKLVESHEKAVNNLINLYNRLSEKYPP